MSQTRPASLLPAITGLALVCLASTPTLADITGFPVQPGWQVNQWDSASLPIVNAPKSITLTTGTGNQSRSMFYEPAKQGVDQFQAKFTYQFAGTAAPGPMGAAFVLHNMPPGPSTVAKGEWSGVKTNFGYTDGTGTFQGPSLAITLESSYLSPGSSSSGVYTGGGFGGGSPATGSVNIFSGNPIDIAISYTGGLLSWTAKDTVTGSTYNGPTYQLDIPAILGGPTAWVGFTASTNNNAGTSQTFSNFSYTTVPSPAAGGLLMLAGLAASRRRR